jgi:hypothetical protein
MPNATLDAAVPSSVIVSRDLCTQAVGPLTVLRRMPELEALVDGLVASWHSSSASLQCRRWHRTRFQKPLTITPIDDGTELPAGPPLAVTGHDISLAGLSFIHDRPLAPRKVAVTFQFDDGTCDSVLTLLKWCRFRRDGLYQSGGQFLRVVALPERVDGGQCWMTNALHEPFAARSS